MDIELPDGTVLQDIPEGTTKAQIVAKLQSSGMAVPKEWIPAVKQDKSKSILAELPKENPFLPAMIGAGEAGLQMLTGLGASAVGGYRGVYGLLTGESGQEAAEKTQAVQQALTYQPRSIEGTRAAEALAAPIEIGSEIMGKAGKEIQKGGEFGRFFDNTSQGLEGEAIGRASVPIAATLYAGRGAIKNVATTPFQKPSMPSLDIPVISDAVRGIRDVVRTRTEPGREKLAQEYLQSLTTPDEAAKIVTSLEKRGTPIVANSPVTSAEAIARANRQLELLGRPERFGSQFVTLQEGLASVPETTASFNTIKLLQEKARADILNKGAGSDLAYKAAEDLRAGNATKNYGAVKNFVLETDKDLNLLMTRPSMEKALQRAAEIAQEQNKIFKIGKDIPEQTIASPLLDATGKPVAQITIPAQYAKYPVQSLQYVKMALDDILKKPQDYGIGASELKFIGDTRSQLTSWLEKKAPLYEKANFQYSIDSLPLQQMDLWRVLQQKFIAPTGKETPGTYLKALKDQTKLIKDATGYQRGSDVSSIFNAKQSALAAKLAAEMEMELVKKRMAGEVSIPGIGKAAEGLEPKLPNMLMRETMVANFLIRQLAKNANTDVNLAAAKILQDPKLLAGVLKQVKPAHRMQILKEIKLYAVSPNTLISGMANIQQQGQQP